MRGDLRVAQRFTPPSAAAVRVRPDHRPDDVRHDRGRHTVGLSGSLYHLEPQRERRGGGAIKISTHLKNSNYSGCDNRAAISADDWVWVRCLKWNTATSHWWVYLRTDVGSNYGWTSLDNFNTIAYDDDGDGAVEYADC